MDKEQKELELKKLEIEKLKIKEGLFRTIILIILTSGAGFGTVLYKRYSTNIVNDFSLVVLGTIIIVFFIVAFILWIDINQKIKRL